MNGLCCVANLCLCHKVRLAFRLAFISQLVLVRYWSLGIMRSQSIVLLVSLAAVGEAGICWTNGFNLLMGGQPWGGSCSQAPLPINNNPPPPGKPSLLICTDVSSFDDAMVINKRRHV